MGRRRDPDSINSRARAIATVAGCSFHAALKWVQEGQVVNRMQAFELQKKIKHGKQLVGQ